MFQEGHLSVSGEKYALTTGNLPLEHLLRNKVAKMNVCPNMTLTVDCGHEALIPLHQHARAIYRIFFLYKKKILQ